MKPVSMVIILLLSCLSLSFAQSGPGGFQFIPPSNIISKERLPIKQLNLIRTQSGRTYLISSDARYVFQGNLVDIWNGVRIRSVQQLNALSDRINFKQIGVEPDKMFSLDQGTGPAPVYIFVDPNCSVCHKLLAKIRDSKLILNRFNVKAIVTPMMSPTSLIKAKQLALTAKDSPEKALSALIDNTIDTSVDPDITVDGVQYNQLVAKALSINNFPYIVNPRGRIFIGLPDDIYLFLSKQQGQF